MPQCFDLDDGKESSILLGAAHGATEWERIDDVNRYWRRGQQHDQREHHCSRLVPTSPLSPASTPPTPTYVPPSHMHIKRCAAHHLTLWTLRWTDFHVPSHTDSSPPWRPRFTVISTVTGNLLPHHHAHHRHHLHHIYRHCLQVQSSLSAVSPPFGSRHALSASLPASLVLPPSLLPWLHLSLGPRIACPLSTGMRQEGYNLGLCKQTRPHHSTLALTCLMSVFEPCCPPTLAGWLADWLTAYVPMCIHAYAPTWHTCIHAYRSAPPKTPVWCSGSRQTPRHVASGTGT